MFPYLFNGNHSACIMTINRVFLTIYRLLEAMTFTWVSNCNLRLKYPLFVHKAISVHYF